MGTIRPQIVLFGDSLTEWSFQVDQTGWGASLANYYARKGSEIGAPSCNFSSPTSRPHSGIEQLIRKYVNLDEKLTDKACFYIQADVLLRGYGGYNSRWAQFLLDKIFPIPTSNPPVLVTVFLGANDASNPNSTHGMLHVPLEEYAENLSKIVAHIKKQSDSTHIVLITPPPVDETKVLSHASMGGDMTGVPTRTSELAKLYADDCVKVAKATGVRVINLWSVFQEAPDGYEKYLSDGLHLSAAGNAKVFEELLKIVDDPSMVPTLKTDHMPWDYPFYTDLGEDPSATLKLWSGPYLIDETGKVVAGSNAENLPKNDLASNGYRV